MNQKDERRRKPEEFVLENIREIGFFRWEQGVCEGGDWIRKMFMPSPLSMEHGGQCDHRQPNGQNKWDPEEKRSGPCVPWDIKRRELFIDTAEALNEANQRCVFVLRDIRKHAFGDDFQDVIGFPARFGLVDMVREDERC